METTDRLFVEQWPSGMRNAQRTAITFHPGRGTATGADMIQDLRYAIRTLLRKPGFAAAAIVVLALGIGANTAIFSVVHGVMLKRLPYSSQERIQLIYMTHVQQNRLDE